MSMSMTVTLSSLPNPDFPARRQGPMIEPRHIWCRDFADASRVCRDFIARRGLGVGNWTGGQIRDDGRLIGRVSYNGRVWDNNGLEVTP